MNRPLTLAGYAVIAAAIVAYEIRALRLGRATFDDAVTVVMRTRLGRVLVLAAWLWLGWHLFVRTRDH